MDKSKDYKLLYKNYQEAFPDKKGNEAQTEVNKIWNSMKCKDNYEEFFKNKIADLTNIKFKKKSKLLNYWSNVS